MQDPVVIVMPLAGAWQTYVEGGAEGQSFDTRYPALEWAHRWAQVHRPSLVRVFDTGKAADEFESSVREQLMGAMEAS